MIDRPARWKAFGSDMFSGVKFAPEGGRALAPVGPGEREKLASPEIAGMRCDDIEKPRVLLGVAKGLKSFEMGRCNVHSVRIPAVMLLSSRTRRKRDASSERP